MRENIAAAQIDFSSDLLPSGGLAFDKFERIIQTSDIRSVTACLIELADAAASGYHAVGFVSYESAPAFDSAFTVNAPGPLPLVWFGLSRTPRPGNVDVPSTAGTPTQGFSPLSPSWNEDTYHGAFNNIVSSIRRGDIYQANLTFPMTGELHGRALETYKGLKGSVATRYGGVIETEDWAVLTLSPELFFERHDSTITTKPMKGTRKRGRTTAEDVELTQELAGNPKDRAENLMIVDLLRNDLGRVATIGTVTVPYLFEVERYPTVLQMTSTVTGEVPENTSLPDIFHALFPCGSVTGAPKVRAMEIIADNEQKYRGVYCGAFGYVAPGGNCVFNVAIRTATVVNGKVEYPIGSGVVADSTSHDEYEECLVKAKTLEAQESLPFSLIETMRWEPDSGIYLLNKHIARLKDSAEYFGFSYDITELHYRIAHETASLTLPAKVRLILERDGCILIELGPLPPPAEGYQTVTLAHAPVDSRSRFLYHKTSNREVYNTARTTCEGADDVLLFNEHMQLTESTIANVACQFGDTWVTPPVSCGLLPGTLRAELLDSKTLIERPISIHELQNASEIHLFNSLRGRYPVRLL